MAAKHLTFKRGKHDKFWSIQTDGSTVRVHFGRSGTQGQTQIRTLASPDDATREMRRLVAQKLNKGYVVGKAPRANAPRNPSKRSTKQPVSSKKPKKQPKPKIAAQAGSTNWTGAPLSKALVKQLMRVGAKRLKRTNVPAGARKEGLSTNMSFYNREHGSWEGVDPLGQAKTVSPTMDFLINEVNWPFGDFREEGDDDERLQLGQASEGYDETYDRYYKRRLVLAHVAYSVHQRYWSINILDTSKDPLVYYIDHEGPPIGGGSWPLSKALARLKKA